MEAKAAIRAVKTVFSALDRAAVAALISAAVVGFALVDMLKYG
jgi:hypothetical protein